MAELTEEVLRQAEYMAQHYRNDVAPATLAALVAAARREIELRRVALEVAANIETEGPPLQFVREWAARLREAAKETK